MTIFKTLVVALWLFNATSVHADSIYNMDLTIYNKYTWKDNYKTVKSKLPTLVIKRGDIHEEDIRKGSLLHTWTDWMNFKDGRKFRTSFEFDTDRRLKSIQLFVDPAHREALTIPDTELILDTLIEKFGDNYSYQKVPDIQARGGEITNVTWEETSSHGMIFLSFNQFCPRGRCVGFSPVRVVYNRPNSFVFAERELFMDIVKDEVSYHTKIYLEKENQELHKRLAYVERNNMELEEKIHFSEEEIEQLLEMGA